ncbi:MULTISPECIES: transglycosylase SLT domain-containing protein [Brevibacillus]|uniref:transglycosylase SLT domain-containing protein n=1 Tax=Brevibacillus TaxID=55080 RepID=UPI0004223181|nr:transglycosylase SLT domain-containing protein [Brevibacillus sp. NSP2.1]QHZ58822.1 transglycosylase SLT domain-containing protein [Brevibacillus sp. NSP2.1]
MRILFLEKCQALLHGLPYGFHDAGHQVLISGLLTERHLPALLQSFRPSLIVMTGWGPELTLTQQAYLCEQIKQAQVPLVYWAEEDPAFVHIWSLPVALRMQVDFVFTVSPETVLVYREAGIRAAHMDFGYDEQLYQPGESGNGPRLPVAVVSPACPYMYRHQLEHDLAGSLHTLIWPLLALGIPVRFYGKEWGQMKPIFGLNIPRDWIVEQPGRMEARQVYRQADIVIEVQSLEKPISERMLQAAGSGSLLLARDSIGLRRIFTPGHDMLASSSPIQTVDLLRHYLERPDERKTLQAHGLRTARSHTYGQRARFMLRTLVEEGILASDAADCVPGAGEHGCPGQPLCVRDARHTVKPGESLWQIACAHGTTIGALQQANRLVSDVLHVGQILRIPHRTAEDGEQLPKIKKWLDKAARLFQLDSLLLYGIAYAESDFGQNAGMSRAGALGIMQLKERTARGLGVDRTDPWQNILGGAMYIKEMLYEFDGDLPMALAAYNWGLNHVWHAVRQGGKQWLTLAPEETQHYVIKIMKYMSEAGRR